MKKGRNIAQWTQKQAYAAVNAYSTTSGMGWIDISVDKTVDEDELKVGDVVELDWKKYVEDMTLLGSNPKEGEEIRGVLWKVIDVSTFAINVKRLGGFEMRERLKKYFKKHDPELAKMVELGRWF